MQNFKAMGGASGGYTASSKEVVTILRQRARPYLFSNTMAPSVVTTALRAYDLIDSEPQLVQRFVFPPFSPISALRPNSTTIDDDG